MKLTNLIILALSGVICACSQPQKSNVGEQMVSVPGNEPDTSRLGTPILPVSTILKDFRSFWAYYSNHVELYEDFSASDPTGSPITKAQFLKQLNTGLYFPLVLTSKPAELRYKLYKLPDTADENIAAYMKQFSTNQLAFYKMEGKEIPRFNFSDINGKVYTPENTKGKIVLFKCWFIGCVACVKEMPALNELVRQYKDRDDILFISLAMDGKKELQKFLSATKFDYATVPGQAGYMADQLKVSAYPTHFLINKEGILVRVLPDEVQVAEALAKLAAP